MKITNCKFLKLFRINAIVLYPIVLYQAKLPDKAIMKHEEVHLKQIKTDGVLKFYTRYLLEYARGRVRGLSHYQAYRNISYEIEAYESS
jgi:hypothetical protein